MAGYLPLSTTGRCKNLPSCMVWRASTIGVSTVAHSGFGVITWRIILGRRKEKLHVKLLPNSPSQRKLKKSNWKRLLWLVHNPENISTQTTTWIDQALVMNMDAETIEEEKEGGKSTFSTRVESGGRSWAMTLINMSFELRKK